MNARGPAARWGWTALAAAAGFATSAICSGVLRWGRDAFVAAWALVALVVWLSFQRAIGLDWRTQLRRRWISGLVIGLIFGALLAATVLRQPASAAPTGARLVTSLLWLGCVYGAVDAVMLSILPVIALYGLESPDRLGEPMGRLRAAGLALLGSLIVTAAYHLGFPEFRGTALILPLIGNAAITFAYLLSGSPVAPLVAHVMMHATALVHGAGSAAQLPPHL